MNKIDFKSMANVGFRFLIFRRAVRKSQMELADEIGVSVTDIQSIENGSSFPEIEFMHNINIEYGLNMNWLLCNEGQMFTKDCPDLDAEYAMRPMAGSVEEMVAQYAGLITLMQIPIVETVLLARLEEFRQSLIKASLD